MKPGSLWTTPKVRRQGLKLLLSMILKPGSGQGVPAPNASKGLALRIPGVKSPFEASPHRTQLQSPSHKSRRIVHNRDGTY
jgi:hypothetical protein